MRRSATYTFDDVFFHHFLGGFPQCGISYNNCRRTMCSAVTDENYAASDILNVNIKSKNGKLQKKAQMC